MDKIKVRIYCRQGYSIDAPCNWISKDNITCGKDCLKCVVLDARQYK
jgi:hypothetical protein